LRHEKGGLRGPPVFEAISIEKRRMARAEHMAPPGPKKSYFFDFFAFLAAFFAVFFFAFLAIASSFG
jgi:hypothetical protein